MKLRMLAESDVGTVRSVNEDFCGIFEEDRLAIVCDGMGGHNAGATASRLAVTTIRYMYLFLDPDVLYQVTRDLIAKELHIAARLIGSIRLANRNVYNKSMPAPNLRGMGTTVSALAIQNGVAVIAHIGDSRIYRFRKEAMELLTDDHTWLNELIQDHEINQEEAEKFEKQNIITRALGLNNSIKIDVGIEPVQQGDLFLICTDGLIKSLTDDEIKRIVLFNKYNLDHTLRHLIDTANMKDGSDNITIALISVEALEPDQNHHPSVYLTLKSETKSLIRLEEKILQRELSHRITSEWKGNHVTKVLTEHFASFSSIAVILVLGILCGIYAFTNHYDKLVPYQIQETKFSNTSHNKTGPLLNTGKKSDWLNQNINVLSMNSQGKAIPDSMINRVIDSSLSNHENLVAGSKLKSRPLQINPQNHGIIYLTGLEKLKNIENASLFINNIYWGKTIDLWNKGLSLSPGLYGIIIRDSTDVILFQQDKILLSVGDVKAIEFKRR